LHGKKATGESVSILIRKVRLHSAKQLLQDESKTVSDVAYEVGFSSTSYFIKCFKEEYGYTPGEAGKQPEEEPTKGPDTKLSTIEKTALPAKRKWIPVIGGLLGITLMAVLYFSFFQKEAPPLVPLEKSIAVLPFHNNSSDSANVYIINGLMDAILGNLQKIEALQVTSRTTTERVRTLNRTIPELAEELDVNYFVEGSGQKVGDQILLSVQLIEGPTDKNIWAAQYERNTKDIFQLQLEVAQNIASAIEAAITPEEQQRIEKIPTDNLVAYDFYLQGLEGTKEETPEGLYRAIDFFQKAVAEDNQFAEAYAYIAICYYYLDLFQTQKKYEQEINTYADKASLIAPELPESLLAKAMFYMQDEQYELAVQFLEKLLDIYPNAGWIHNFLTDIYTSYLPNTEKYLMHAIQGIAVARAEQDSTTASNTYLHLSNALAQTGFIQEAEQYIQQSLALNPDNIFSKTVGAYIQLAKDGNLKKAKASLVAAYEKDRGNLLVLQEIAKICYFMEDYEAAQDYYQQFLDLRERLDWSVYESEMLKVAFVLQQLGQDTAAQPFLERYRTFIENEESGYKDLGWAAYYAIDDQPEKAMSHFKAFAAIDDYEYWIVLFLEKDPIMSKLNGHPDFKPTLDKISNRFWEKHQQLKAILDEAGVL
jgi:TolB-like protein/Tfp pilus assembly protein PilF